jgi:hypothetical protein
MEFFFQKFEVSLFKTWYKLMMFQKSFCKFKAICHNIFFIKREPFFLKIEEEFNIDDYRSKSTWNW